MEEVNCLRISSVKSTYRLLYRSYYKRISSGYGQQLTLTFYLSTVNLDVLFINDQNMF